MPNDLSAAQSLIAALQAEVQHLKVVADKYRHLLFGKSSERYAEQDVNQLVLALGEIAARRAAPAPTPAPGKAEPAPKQPRRQPLPPHLPRVRREFLPEHTHCPDCGGALKVLGEDSSEQLELTHAWSVILNARPKLACTKCDRILQAPAPSQPIQGGIAGAGLLAHVMVGKFCDGLPFYRQSGIYARDGIEIDRSTMVGWSEAAHKLMVPLYEALRQHVFGATKLHTDDTPVRVLAPGKTREGRIWTYVRDDRDAGSSQPPAVWYAYTGNRQGKHPREHLKGFKGVLQVDAFIGYKRVFETGDVKEASCWAHLRRRFFEAYRRYHESPIANEALRQIRALYDIEADIRGQPPPIRLDERRRRAVPIIERFHDWMQASLRTVSGKNELGGAIHYALARWPSFQLYAGDGAVEIDNNIAERTLRTVAITRKNFVFFGSDTGGERAATFYSLINSAKLNGLDPQRYLREVFTSIADHPMSRIAELLPWNIALANN